MSRKGITQETIFLILSIIMCVLILFAFTPIVAGYATASIENDNLKAFSSLVSAFTGAWSRGSVDATYWDLKDYGYYIMVLRGGTAFASDLNQLCNNPDYYGKLRNCEQMQSKCGQDKTCMCLLSFVPWTGWVNFIWNRQKTTGAVFPLIDQDFATTHGMSTNTAGGGYIYTAQGTETDNGVTQGIANLASSSFDPTNKMNGDIETDTDSIMGYIYEGIKSAGLGVKVLDCKSVGADTGCACSFPDSTQTLECLPACAKNFNDPRNNLDVILAFQSPISLEALHWDRFPAKGCYLYIYGYPSASFSAACNPTATDNSAIVNSQNPNSVAQNGAGFCRLPCTGPS